MSTSDMNRQRKAWRRGSFTTVAVYLVLSVLAVVVDHVYALFGHGVRSASMSFMFLYPLLGGALLFFLLGLIAPNIGGGVYRTGYNLYNSGIATLTVGSFFKGILDIAGTASSYSGVFMMIGWILAGIGLCVLIAAAAKGEEPKSQLPDNRQDVPMPPESADWKQAPVNICKGAVIGVGAILPGISGGVLCVVVGIYKPMMAFLSHPVKAFQKYHRLLLPVLIGWAIGFLVLARVVDILFRVSKAPAIWLFIGLIAGTFPSLFRTAGEKGRTTGSWVAVGVCFTAFLSWMIFLSSSTVMQIEPSMLCWIVCGLLWGVGLIIPGLSPSAFLIVLGLYQPMTAGIADLSLEVILPLIAGIVLVVLLFTRLANRLFERTHNLMYHSLLGIVAASTIAMIPTYAAYTALDIYIYAICFVLGLACALAMDKLGGRASRPSQNTCP